MEDGRCKLGVAGRLQLVLLIEGGCSFRTAADESAVSVATAHRWWRRWVEASEAERASRSCLRARPPVPRSCPWALSAEAEQRILRARTRTNLGPARLAGLVGYRRSTIWKVLKRHGCSQRRRTAPQRFTRRYEWAEPGALLHMDAKQLPVFTAPGHWAHGNRSLQQRRPVGSRRLEFAHVVVDDRSRLAYVEVHRHDRGDIAAQVLLRAAAWMTEQGAGPVEAVMTDNAFAYTKSNAFMAPCASSRPATSASRLAHRAGTAKPSASSEPSTKNGPTAGSGPTAPDATAPWHPSFATTTAAGHTPHSATGHPSAAFTKTEGRTPRRGRSSRSSPASGSARDQTARALAAGVTPPPAGAPAAARQSGHRQSS